MKRIVMLAALTIAACEGEPPKVPVSGPPVAAEPPPPTPAEAPDAGASAASLAPATAGPCCVCCPAADAGPVAANDASAPAEAAVLAPAEVAKYSVTGTVTTTPAAQAANAVVYLSDAPVDPAAKMAAQVDNRQMTFYPYITVVPAGARVAFHNSDPFPHNVFSPDNEKFNLGTITQWAAVGHTFKTTGTYTLLCNLHPGMIGYVVVSPSSYFAKADSKGRYTIKDVPPGTYKVVAWAPRQQSLEQSATLQGADVTLNFDLHR